MVKRACVAKGASMAKAACMVKEGMCGKEGEVSGKEVYMAGETVTAADGGHHTWMHSCSGMQRMRYFNGRDFCHFTAS